MESLKCRHYLGLSLLIPLSILFIPGHAQVAPGAILRTKKQLLLASIQPDLGTPSSSVSSQLFLTSPSGSSAAYLVRQPHGHELHDYCYIQIEETNGGSVWQSSCASVSHFTSCSLVFSDSGIEIYDGNKYSWSTDSIPIGDHTEILILPDGGDMQIIDQRGTIVWSASQNNQVANQNCGLSSLSPSSLSETGGVSNAALTPLAAPSGRSSPLDQFKEQTNEESQVAYQQQQLQGLNNYPQGPRQTLNQPFLGFNQPFSSFNQPFGTSSQQGLLDGAPFEIGVSRKTIFLEIPLVYMISLVAFLIFYFSFVPSFFFSFYKSFSILEC